MSIIKKNLTPLQALQKTKQYCAYQERCHQEVRNKFFQYGLTPNEVEECIGILITENYLNEERFAILYAGGKFRTKQWGKQKIKYALKQKQISDYCIKKALVQIDPDDYWKTFEKTAEKRMEQLKAEKNIFIKKRKLSEYLQQKGFEQELIAEYLKKI